MPRQSNTAVMRRYVTLAGHRVLDVGCGHGPLVRYMTRHGAYVTGLECGRAQLQKACATTREGGEVYVEGVGQDMPFSDNSFDIVVFFNSLHHIPVDQMDRALCEATRVVKPTGIVYIAEPIAEGPSFEMFALVDDETEVRARAVAAIERISSKGGRLEPVDAVQYDTAHFYDSFASLRKESVRIDPARRTAFEANDSMMRNNFERLGVPDEKGYRFDQPMAVTVLRKPEDRRVI